MNFIFTVLVSVERDEGKFASRDEIAAQLQEALYSADPDSVDGVGVDGSSTYSVTTWDVVES